MIRVIVADSSAVNRSIEKQMLKCNSRFEFCAECATEDELSMLVKTKAPDVILADYSIFNNKNFESTLYTLAIYRCPVVYYAPENLVHANAPKGIKLTAKPGFRTFSQDALIDYSQKLEEIVSKLRIKLSERNYKPVINSEPVKNVDVNYALKKYSAVCVGVSTGGPGTVLDFLKNIGTDFALPIFITQHIDASFDKNLIDWLGNNAPMPVQFAENNMNPKPGNVYFAPANRHLVFEKNQNGNIVLKLNNNPPRNFLRPAVDEMFDSAAVNFGNSCISVLLTGMGSDGAEGSCRIKERGGYTIAQDENSCVVYGMPKAAVDAGGIVEVLALSDIPRRVKKLVNKK